MYSADERQGWILSGRNLSLLLLVHAKGSRDENLVLLLCIGTVWSIQWSACRSHRQDGWRRRIRRLEMDLSFGRHLLIDSPALSGRWLKPDEIRFLELQRFIKDGGRFGEEKQESFKWSDLKAVLCNWRLYMQAYILLCISACSYGTYNLE
jgi:hypothetical protein